MRVPKHTEDAWTRTVVEETLEAIRRGTDVFQLADLYSHTAALAEELRDVALVRRLRDAAVSMIPSLPRTAKLPVAETLVGDVDGTHRQGLIVQAIQLGDISLARSLASLVPQLCDAPPARSFREQDLARRAEVRAWFRTLQARLKLSDATPGRQTPQG